MRKRQDGGDRTRERLADFIRSLSLTWQERAMVAVILVSMLAGAVVMHYRREYRMTHPVVAPGESGKGAESR